VTRDASEKPRRRPTVGNQKGDCASISKPPKFPGHELAVSASLKNWVTEQEDGRYKKIGQSGN
jgi:hypothetical protein